MSLMTCSGCGEELATELNNVRCINCQQMTKLCDGCANVFVACSLKCIGQYRESNGRWMDDYLEPKPGRTKKPVEGQGDLF